MGTMRITFQVKVLILTWLQPSNTHSSDSFSIIHSISTLCTWLKEHGVFVTLTNLPCLVKLLFCEGNKPIPGLGLARALVTWSEYSDLIGCSSCCTGLWFGGGSQWGRLHVLWLVARVKLKWGDWSISCDTSCDTSCGTVYECSIGYSTIVSLCLVQHFKIRPWKTANNIPFI